MPKPGENFISYDKYWMELKVPYIILADFESILIPLSEPADKGSLNIDTHRHFAMSYSYIVISDEGTVIKSDTYFGEDAARM